VEPNKATVFLNATETDDSKSANNYGIDALDRHQGDWPPHAY